MVYNNINAKLDSPLLKEARHQLQTTMKKIAVLLLLCLVIIPAQSYSQPSSTSSITRLLQQSQIALDQEDYSRALEYAKSALTQLPEKGADSLRMAVNGMMGEVLYNLDEFYDAVTYFEKAVKAADVVEVTGSKYLRRILNDQGVCYAEFDDCKNAIKCFKRALILNQKDGDLDLKEQAKYYTNLGVCYNKMLDFDNAFLYFTKVLEIDKKEYGENSFDVAIDYNNLGLCLEKRKDYDTAINYHNKSLEIRTNLFGPNHPRIAIALNNIGICNKLKGNYNEALKYFEKCLKVRERELGQTHYYVVYTLYNIGNVYLEKGEYDIALRKYFLAVERGKASIPDKSPKILNIYEKIAEIYQAKKEYEIAEAYCRRVIDNLGKGSNVTFGYDDIQHPMNLLDAYSLLQNILYYRFQDNNDTADLFLALSIQDTIIGLMESLKMDFEEGGSKEYFIEDYLGEYEIFMETLLLLREETLDNKYSFKAFQVCEKSKSFLLLEALQTTDARKFAGIPDSLLKKEQQLALDITDLEWEKFDLLEKSGEVKEQEILALDGKIFDKKKIYHALLADYESNYPAYFKMKYEVPEITVEKIQDELLNEQQTLLEYFMGEKNHYVFAINKDTFLMKRLAEGEPLQQLVKNYHRLLATFPQLLLEGDAQIDSLNRLGLRLYQYLLAPVKAICKKELIIIPDGELAYLPFETLIQSRGKSRGDFAETDWLLKEYAISYCNSAALLIELREEDKEKETNSRILTVSPSFGEGEMPLALRSAALGPLTHNVKEAADINQLFGGTCLSGKFATADSFKLLAPQYQFLHLATHAVANDQAGDFSFLAFAPSEDSTQASELYAKDIYNLQLDAEMVVLSACETGVGELKRGEGMISLARAFTYAGAKSILNSIWQVNDKKTADLMNRFYHHLAKGEQKHIALQKAKLEMLESGVGQSSHPFYWAAFKAYGNMKPVEVNEKGWTTFWPIIAIAIIIFFSFRFYRGRKKKKPVLGV